MLRILYGPGAHGGTVGDIQRALLAAGFDPQGTDGLYGRDTGAAVTSFQQARGLPTTGFVDDATWQALMQKPLPATNIRSLELTAAFEGHGYTLAQGNWDGAWLTWGIIGFTLKHGEVSQIILSIQANTPQLVRQAFGDKADELIRVMRDSPENQQAWANSVSVGSRLVEPWRSGFALLGQFPQVQEAQRQRAFSDYFVPAVNTAKSFSLKSELGLALAFDIHVQNGGVHSTARAAIQNALAAQPPSTEQALREIIANAVADAADPSFSADVRQRKLTVARGVGEVHGGHFVLANWGLSESPASELG